jgi:16S rRNA G1207 methylase RsmC
VSTRTRQPYFEHAYAGDAQGFGRVDGWHETRKRQILLSSLMQPRYTSVFEPGGGIAALTIPLAARSDHLLMMDSSVSALKYAREAMAGYNNVEFYNGALPESWPQQRRFDLIVFSEFLYYLSEAAVLAVARQTLQSLTAGGEIALIHWRHASADYPLTAQRAHATFIEACDRLQLRVVHEDRDFILHILA